LDKVISLSMDLDSLHPSRTSHQAVLLYCGWSENAMLSPPENSTLKSGTVTALTADHGLSVTRIIEPRLKFLA
jgi:hypothetical protein